MTRRLDRPTLEELCGPYHVLVGAGRQDFAGLELHGCDAGAQRRVAIRIERVGITVRSAAGDRDVVVAELPAPWNRAAAERVSAHFGALLLGHRRPQPGGRVRRPAVPADAEVLAGRSVKALRLACDVTFRRLQDIVATSTSPASGAIAPELVQLAVEAERAGQRRFVRMVRRLLARPATEALLDHALELHHRRCEIDFRYAAAGFPLDPHRPLRLELWTPRTRAWRRS